MKSLSIAAGLIALGGLSMSGVAAAACQGQLTAATELSGKTLCVTKSNGDRFQEYHRADGALIDWKRGSTDPVDPTKQVGSWSAAGNEVVYTYGSMEYRYTVYRPDNSNNFCLQGNGEEITPTNVLSVQAACP